MAGMNGSRAHKVGPEEANGLEWARKERRNASKNEPQQTQSNASKESKGLMEDSSAPRMRYKVIGPGKPKKVSKGPWESMIEKRPRKSKKSKWAKDAQEGNGT